MRTRTIRNLMASVSIATSLVLGGVPILHDVAHAAAPVTYQAKSLTADQLLAKQKQAFAFIHKNFKAMPKMQRRKSAPFIKALKEASKLVTQVEAAARKKDPKALSAALPKMNAAIAKLNRTYELSGLRDKNISVGMKTLNDVWKQYLKRVAGGKNRNAKQAAVKNNRRISGMRNQLAKLKQAGKNNPRDRKTFSRLDDILARAERANRDAAMQWYVALLLAEYYGYYEGTYYYVAAYDPTAYTYYQTEWTYFYSQYEYTYTEYYEYYESYSWTSYETSVTVTESYDFGYTETQYAEFEQSYTASYESIETSATELYQSYDEAAKIEAVDAAATTAAPVEDAAATADPVADAVAEQVTDTGADPATALDVQAEPDQTAAEPDQPAADQDQNAAEPDQNQQQDEAQPDDGQQQDEAQPDDGQQQDEAQPDDGQQQDEAQPDDGQQQDEAQPDDGQQQDEALPDDGQQQDEALPDDGQQQDEAQPDDGQQQDEAQPEEPLQDEAQPEEPSYEEPAPEEPAAEEPAPEEPAYEEPAPEEPAYEEPAAEEPAYEEPAAEEPAYEEPTE